MNKEDYIKVVYESSPIGEEKIILKLTTFDVEGFNKKEELKEVPQKREAVVITTNRYDLERPDFRFKLEQQLNYIVCQRYEQQIQEMKSELEMLKRIKIVPMEYGK